MSNNTRMQKQIAPKKHVSHTALNRSNPAQVDQKTAMEFTQILKKHSDKESASEKERESVASVEKSRQLNTATTASTGAQAPSLFMQSGASYFAHHDEGDDTPVTGGYSSTSNDISYAIEFSGERANHQEISMKAEGLAESLHKDWLKQSVNQTMRKWTIELTSLNQGKTSIDIEYSGSGEWHVQIRNDEDNGQAGDFTYHDETPLSTRDEYQFCIELKAQLEKTNPSIRLTTGVTTGVNP